MKAIETNDILRILKECAKLGVTHLKMGELEISFSPVEDKADIPKKVREKPKLQAQYERESIETQEVTVKQKNLDELLLSDPEEYERLIIEGELVDEEAHDSGVESTLQ